MATERWPGAKVTRLEVAKFEPQRAEGKTRGVWWPWIALAVLIAIGVAIMAEAQALSPDGSTLVPGGSGSLVTSAGTWTFGAAVPGGNAILLNGASTNGAGVELEVSGGAMYAQVNPSSGSYWFEYVSGSWVQQSGAPGGGSSSSSTSSSSPTYSITVTWQAPTEYTDNSAIPAGTAITYSLLQAIPPDLQSLTPVASGISGTSYLVTGLAAGTYCFAGTDTVGGATSALSALTAGSAACATVPGQTSVKIPMPPGNVTAVPQ